MDLITEYAQHLEPLIKRRIIEEVHRITDQVIVEEATKLALKLVSTASIVDDGRTLTFVIHDRREK